MQRNEAKGKKSAFFKDVLPLSTAVQTKNGPSNIALKMEKGRANRVIEKIVRGYYFHFFKELLGDVEFHIDLVSSVIPTGNRNLLLKLIAKILEAPTWGQNFGAYTYAGCGLAEDDNRAGMWWFKFFGQHFAVVLSCPTYFSQPG